MTTHNGHAVRFIQGNKIKGWMNQWYRHDQIEIDGQILGGHVQVRMRHMGQKIGYRIDSMTCHEKACVMGCNWQWLARQNGIDVGQYPLFQEAS